MATDTADVGAGGRHGCAHNGVMRAVLQRARSASVTVEGEVVGELSGPGLVVLLGVSTEDTEAQAVQLAQKVWNLRMLEDEQSCASAAAPLLVVSQFTLYGDVRKGGGPPGPAPHAAIRPNRCTNASWPSCARRVRRWSRGGSGR